MQPRRATGLIWLFLLLTGPATVSVAEADPTTPDARCAQVAGVRPPPADVPTQAQRQALAGCDAEALYYGIGRQADPPQARRCAFVQQSQESDRQPFGFSGSHMLMVIYANGIGASRNIPYAIHLACTSSWAEAERDGRIAYLLGYREHRYKNQFGFCDDATSGLTGGYCAAHDDRLKQQERLNALASYAASLPAGARPAFMALTRAQAAWGEVRSRNEVDLSGTLRAAFEIDERALQEQDFVDMVNRLKAGHPPHLGPADLAVAQARMQATLNHILADRNALNAGTVTREGVAEAQNVWESYRDAWGAFADIAYQAWGAAAAEAWVTMKRADMLSRLT